jgi:flagellar biosynthesis/type III secretory pathway protein FliH
MGYVDTMKNADQFKQTFNNEAQTNAAKAKALDAILSQKEAEAAEANQQAVIAAATNKGLQVGHQQGVQKGVQAGEQMALSKLLQAVGV